MSAENFWMVDGNWNFVLGGKFPFAALENQKKNTNDWKNCGLRNIYCDFFKIDPKVDPENVLVNQQMLPCPEASLVGSTVQKPLAPLNFVLTEFHVLLLYNDHVKGISLLNQELIFEDIYNDVSRKKGNDAEVEK